MTRHESPEGNRVEMSALGEHPKTTKNSSGEGILWKKYGESHSFFANSIPEIALLWSLEGHIYIMAFIASNRLMASYVAGKVCKKQHQRTWGFMSSVPHCTMQNRGEMMKR